MGWAGPVELASVTRSLLVQLLLVCTLRTTALGAVLSRLEGQESLVLGAPVQNRGLRHVI